MRFHASNCPAGIVFSLVAAAQLLCATPEYTDIGKASGLGTPVLYGGVGSSQYILETTGTGAAIFDFDRDGDNDIFIVNGTTFALEEAGESPTSMLYVNDGTGKFQESAVKAGIDATGWGQAACLGDIDNDGWDDLLVTMSEHVTVSRLPVVAMDRNWAAFSGKIGVKVVLAG